MGGIFQYFAKIRNVKKKASFLNISKTWNSDFYNNLKGLQPASTPNSQVYAFVNQGWKNWKKSGLSKSQFTFFFLPRRILFCLISFTDVNFEENMV